jgi:hypothetical protein
MVNRRLIASDLGWLVETLEPESDRCVTLTQEARRAGSSSVAAQAMNRSWVSPPT